MMNFEDWFAILQDFAANHGECVHDEEAWRGAFEQGQSAEEAFYDEYPEHRG